MADSAGTDTHRMCTRTCLAFLRLDPLSPRTLPMPLTILPFLPPPPLLRMHVLAETANEDSSFL